MSDLQEHAWQYLVVIVGGIVASAVGVTCRDWLEAMGWPHLLACAVATVAAVGGALAAGGGLIRAAQWAGRNCR